ncbi:cytoplasmic protein [Bacillus thuringiensis]|uniref:Cytoplasmic protein n=1 Tax=Bacillus thuringiensis TaxID=1428 RepID=A0A9X7GEF3_BACTU|nr:cytoplasmic protein [Bacillus thuringiensis]PFL09687.1 cytoplasmic protein [Bacillus thuringiensis]PFV32207.1 cytoplasmic protein [Bacillus thuringiensis]PGN28628.1 cytoplasmic protein [Bacillus thuringiensis]PGN29042.1 cytoplasmic protein [Bacillus thuringiensis]PGU42659.1 cytoplasmic protein [Bacillus thuringiensis]
MAKSNENDLTEKLAEGHRKYGDGNFTVQNIGDETNPNWTVVKNVRKGSAGIREGEDILRLRSKYIK